ncbi:MAG: tetratricopeptide repeat protein, partial [Planctomycetota bacterium]
MGIRLKGSCRLADCRASGSSFGYRLLLVALASCFLSVDVSTADDSQDRAAKILFNTASRLYRQENWSEASAAFGRFLAAHPKHADAIEARFARGYSLYRLKKFGDAEKDLSIASRDRGRTWSPDAANYLARSLDALATAGGESRSLYRRAADSYGSAASQWTAARKKSPNAKRRDFDVKIAGAKAAQGESLYRSGDFTAAAAVLSSFLGSPLTPTTSSSQYRGLYFLALSRYGTAASRNGSNDEAIQVLARLTGSRFEKKALWEEAAFLEARLRQHAGEAEPARALYQRLAKSGRARAPESAYYSALMDYETGTEASLRSSQASFDAFVSRCTLSYSCSVGFLVWKYEVTP